MKISVDQWNAAIRAVLVKSTTDHAFRAKCLTDPAGAIAEVSELTAPAGVKFAETETANAIVLPPVGGDPDEITESELLSNVAGGGAWGYPSVGDGPNVNCEA